jgi:hypothetical protein
VFWQCPENSYQDAKARRVAETERAFKDNMAYSASVQALLKIILEWPGKAKDAKSKDLESFLNVLRNEKPFAVVLPVKFSRSASMSQVWLVISHCYIWVLCVSVALLIHADRMRNSHHYIVRVVPIA